MNYLIVGAGISGVTAGRLLAESGEYVEIWDRRDHIAGNMYDYVDEYGILVHKYGPHIFHTDNEEVWEFVNRFMEWKPFKLVCGASWDGKYTTTAFNFKTIDTFYEKDKADILKKKLLEAYNGRKTATVVEVLNNPDPDIREYAEFLFRNDYAPYTAKQWGIPVEEIDPDVLKRVPIRLSYEESYFTDRHEAMPVHSYTRLFENMLDHPNISVKLGVDALEHIKVSGSKLLIDGKDDTFVIYSGALDELFEYRYGALPYRSLKFEWKYDESDNYQEAPVVAYPKAEGFTRITEYRKLPVQNVNGTSYAVEYPVEYKAEDDSEPYYPVLTEESSKKYSLYSRAADDLTNCKVIGRLGCFRYYNMDQAVESAMRVVSDLCRRRGVK